MKKKQVLAVSSALMIGTTTALTGIPTPVMAQENTEVVQEAVVEENKTEEVPVEQKTENTEVQENAADKEQEEILSENAPAENTETSKEETLTEESVKQEAPVTEEKETASEAKKEEKNKNEEVKAGSIAVDEAHFPDSEFRRYIEDKIDKSKDKILSPDEIEQVTEISYLGFSSTGAPYYDIRDLQGIEYFTSLQNLEMGYSKISDLEAVKNPDLRTLNCNGCSELKTVNVNKFPLLEKLWVMGCEKVESLTLTNCADLKELSIGWTNLSTIDLTQNSKLEDLNISGTPMTQIDLSQNVALQKIQCVSNNLEGLDVSNNLELEEIFWVGSTTIKGIDVTKNTKLKKLDCSALFWADLGNNPNLTFSTHHYRSLDISLTGNTFDLKKEVDEGIDISKVTITSNGVLDKKTGIVTVDDITKPVIYEYDCGLSKEGHEVLTITININGNIVNALPTISANDVTLNVGDTFDPLAGVTATDKEDGIITLTKDNIIANDVDTSKAGTYHVTYKVTDKNGAATEKTITVIVKQNTGSLNSAPTISANDVILNVGDTFDPLAGVTAMDKEDGTIVLTKDNVITNDVDTSKAGTYHVTYKVTDKNGATAEKIITVTIKEKATNKPVNPQQSQKPNNTTKPNGHTETPKTGDMSNWGLFASMFAGSTGTLAVLFGRKRKRNKRD